MFNLRSEDIKRLTNDGREKNSICRDSFPQLYADAIGVKKEFIFDRYTCTRMCRYGDKCIGSHSLNELFFAPHNARFALNDKKRIDFVQIYVSIIKVFDLEKTMVIEPNLRNRIENYQELNFIQLLNLWYDLACYHRGLIKDFTKEYTNDCGFEKIEDIPRFKIVNEDTVWAFERLTKYCAKYKDFEEKISLGIDKVNIKDICNHGALNCKHGVHNDSFLVCHEDFLTGKCKCMTQDFIEKRKSELKELLNGDGKEFVRKQKKNSIRKLREELRHLDNYQRKVHFTDDVEFVPFNIKLNEYNKEQEILRKKKENVAKEKEKQEQNRQEQLSTTSIKQKKMVKPKF